MKLPNWESASVPKEKVTDYLLCFSHEEGLPKATLFSRFGFSAEEWKVFALALVQHAGEHEVDAAVPTKYGMRYIVIGELETPDGRRPVVKVIWSVGTEGSEPRLITAYPGRKKKDD